MTLATLKTNTPAPVGTRGRYSDNPNSTIPITAVCLDIDDTLVDYGSSMRAGLREMLGADDAWPAWCATTERHYPRFTAGEVDSIPCDANALRNSSQTGANCSTTTR
ncbi:MAG: hypothetical protein LC799_33530, partial [Actinobacteria bacterium]|nr:hypothetical protein [Actinomycetota bacterium]